MSIWENLFGKHGHSKDPIIKELLETIRSQEKIELFQVREIERLTKELQRILHPQKPHPIKFDVVFS